MAQNVTVAGASYSDVPSVTLPKTGGGTASFTDVTGTTAIAADVASGKYFFTASGTLTLGTASSGGGAVTPDQDGYLVLSDQGGGGGGATGLVYETGTYTPESDIVQPTISFTNTHTNPPISIIFYDATGTEDLTTNTSWSFVWADYEQFGGATVSWSSTIVKYASMYSWYRGTSTTALSTVNASITYPYSNTDDSANTCYRYWVTASAFKPSSNSSSRYWRSGRTYKWIAIWAPTS